MTAFIMLPDQIAIHTAIGSGSDNGRLTALGNVT